MTERVDLRRVIANNLSANSPDEMAASPLALAFQQALGETPPSEIPFRSIRYSAERLGRRYNSWARGTQNEVEFADLQDQWQGLFVNMETRSEQERAEFFQAVGEGMGVHSRGPDKVDKKQEGYMTAQAVARNEHLVALVKIGGLSRFSVITYMLIGIVNLSGQSVAQTEALSLKLREIQEDTTTDEVSLPVILNSWFFPERPKVK